MTCQYMRRTEFDRQRDKERSARRSRVWPNNSLNPRPATAATVWPLQAMVEIVLPRPVGVCLLGRG